MTFIEQSQTSRTKEGMRLAWPRRLAHHVRRVGPAVRYVVEPPDRAAGEVGTVPDAPGALVGERQVRSLRAPDGEVRTEHGSGLGQTRSVVKRSLSGMGNFRRLKLGYERFGEHFPAFHELAACLICVNRIEQLALNSSGF